MALSTHHTMLFKQTPEELPPLPWAAPPPTSLQPSDTDGSRALALGPFCSELCLDRVSQAFEGSGLFSAPTPACPGHLGVCSLLSCFENVALLSPCDAQKQSKLFVAAFEATKGDLSSPRRSQRVQGCPELLQPCQGSLWAQPAQRERQSAVLW